MIHKALAAKLPVVREILRRYGVKRAFAFGSVCTSQFTEQSDIDLLIDFDETLTPVQYGENYFTLIAELEIVLKRPVDLVTERSLKNPFFIRQVNQTKALIYE